MTDSNTTATKDQAFSDAEKAAMKEAVKEQKAASKRKGKDLRAEGEKDIQAKIAELPDDEAAMATRIHELMTETAPDLMPRTWYGMPAYAKDGKVLCFFKPASKFGARYATLGFSDVATLDDGEMWPTEYAIAKLTGAEEQAFVALITKAIG